MFSFLFVLVALVGGAHVGGVPAQESGPLAFARTDLSIGAQPSAVMAIDVSGDGVLDLVAATSGVSIWIGDGTGGFTEGATVPAGENPVDLAAADFNEDGHLDLAVANHETRYVTLLLGDGTGGFSDAPGSPLSVDLSPHPHAVAAADVNEDGHADLLVDDRRGEGFVLLLGRGDGRFETSGSVNVGGDPYRGLEVADLNRDGHVDLLAPIERGVAVALGDGQGAFRLLPELRSGVRSPFAVAAADVNGDGIVDVGVGSGEGADDVAIALGDGSGEFRPVAGSPFVAGVGGKKMSAADLDDDGFDDILVTSWNAPYLTILYGGGTGIRQQRVEVGRNPWAIAIADLDGDGDRDIVVGNSGDSSLTILLSGG